MENIISLVTNLGFPVAVTAYLLVRTENRLSELKDSINALTIAINNKQVVS